ncbi:trafficking kinesin-binding protein 1 isoform X1 [Silurus meridionalis]|nr:trafficking kinesin-binding protein 1 isoform X1 [Silurus meridionalis]
MEVWISSGTEESERESSQDEEDEEDREQRDVLHQALVKVLCSERVGQVTKTYHDIEAVTHLLEEKERDLELAARIGQSLLKQNKTLKQRNELLDEQLEAAKEEIAQLRHELSMRDDLLQLYTGTEEIEAAAILHLPIRRNESSSSLSNYVHYDFLQTKLKSLEEENFKLRTTANELTSETSSYEEQEQQLMMVCVEELSSANKHAVALSEELARKVEDSLRQQEEISSLLGQMVDLQQRCKVLIRENEELTQHLNTSRESQSKLRTELKDLHERYSECEDMLQEAREDIKNLRNKSLPNSTVQRYSSLAAVFPMDSLAAEIEGTFRKGLDSPASSEYKTHPWRVFETVKVANQVARLRSRGQSPQVPSSSPASLGSSRTSTPRTSFYGSDSVSINHEEKSHSVTPLQEQSLVESKRLGQPGMPGGQDLEEALRSLSARQENHSSDCTFFEVERERKLRALGSVTLHHWQQLAKPNLGGIFHPRPGILTKDFRELDVDIQHVYSLNDIEEDEPNWSKLPNPIHIPGVASSGFNFPHTCPTHTITNSQILHPSVLLSSLSTSFQPDNLSTTGCNQHVRNFPDHQHGSFHRPSMNTTPTLGLIRLLQERGISASSKLDVSPVLRPSVSTLNDKETDVGSSRGAKPPRRNIFSFNLVDKLQSLGLHKVVARGLKDSGMKEGDSHDAPSAKH